MEKRRALTTEIIDTFLHLIIFYGFFATVLFLTHSDTAYLWQVGLIFVPFAINFFLRRIGKNIVFSVALHLVAPILVIMFSPNDVIKVHWMTMTFALALHSVLYPYYRQPAIYRQQIIIPFKRANVSANTPEARREKAVGGEYSDRFKNTQKVFKGNFVLGIVVVFTALAVITSVSGYWPLPLMHSVIILILLIGRLVHLRMAQMDTSLDAKQSSSKIAVEKIITFDYKLTAVSVLLLIASTLVLYFLLIAPALNMAADLLPGLPNLRPAEYDGYLYTIGEAESIGASEPWLMRLLLGLMLMDTVPDWLKLLLSGFLRLFAGALILIGISLVIIGIARTVIRVLSFRSYKHGLGFVAEGREIEREFIFDAEKPRKPPRYNRSGEHPTRRLFRETVAKHKSKGVPIEQSDTPAEIAERITTENIKGLVEEYAPVRYGKK